MLFKKILKWHNEARQQIKPSERQCTQLGAHLERLGAIGFPVDHINDVFAHFVRLDKNVAP